MNRHSIEAKFVLLFLLMPFMLATAQTPKSPLAPTQIGGKERTIQDLLYFPFTCINADMPTKDIAWQLIMDTFNTCETINGNPGLHAGDSFDFTANLTAALKTAWNSCVSAAKAAKNASKATWFEINIPNFDSFYFAGLPTELGVNEMGVDAVIESTLHIVPNQIAGWATKST